MKRALPIFLAILLLAGCAGRQEENTYRQISMQEVAQIMEEQEGYILLDVRTYKEFEAGHIPGAICIPNESIGSEAIDDLPDKDQLILIYCRSGNRSKQAAQKLAEQGYTNLAECGGIRDWTGEVVSGS